MVKLTKIYTKSGDSGTTALGSGERRPKHDIRISAIGTIDETNSFVGMARSKITVILLSLDGELSRHYRKHKGNLIQKNNFRKSSSRTAQRKLIEKLLSLDDSLMGIQNDLFDLGGDLTIVESDSPSKVEQLRVLPTQVEAIEVDIDKMNKDLSPLRSFVLPGGNEVAAILHLARTVCRRAERLVSELAEKEAINAEAFRYLNRLSDFLFVAARWVNNNGDDDVLWVPGKNR